MKRSELFFGAIVLPLDLLALLLAGTAAYYLRVNDYVEQLRPATFVLDLPFVEFVQLTSIVSLAIVAIFAAQGMYVMQSTRRALEETTKIFSGITLGMMLVIVFIFLRAELFQSRFILLAAYVLSLLFVVFGRYVVRRMQRAMLQRGYGVHRAVLVGNGRFADELTRLFESRPAMGYKVIGNLSTVRWEFLEELHRTHGVDEVIQTHPTLSEKDNLVLLDFCDQYKIDYKYVPNLFEAHASHVRYRQFGSVPLMELIRTPLDGWGRIAKRVMDIFGGVVGMILLSPLFAAVAIAIKLDSDGPVFYRQTRVGRNMEPFETYKFRSMKSEYCVGEKYGGKQAQQMDQKLRAQSNERKGPLFKMKNDPRITKIGRFIRKWRIDELPQLINVLKGEMSLMGPRPHLPHEVAQYDKYQRKLFTIKPGMTGMAQVAGNAGLPFDEEAKIDITYIENWSLRLDVVLLLKTFRILFTDPNAV